MYLFYDNACFTIVPYSFIGKHPKFRRADRISILGVIFFNGNFFSDWFTLFRPLGYSDFPPGVRGNFFAEFFSRFSRECAIIQGTTYCRNLPRNYRRIYDLVNFIPAELPEVVYHLRKEMVVENSPLGIER